jgi:hypothetical protein
MEVHTRGVRWISCFLWHTESLGVCASGIQGCAPHALASCSHSPSSGRVKKSVRNPPYAPGAHTIPIRNRPTNKFDGHPIAFKNRGTLGRLLISLALDVRAQTCQFCRPISYFAPSFERGLSSDLSWWHSPMLLVERLIFNLLGEVNKNPPLIKEHLKEYSFENGRPTAYQCAR